MVYCLETAAQVEPIPRSRRPPDYRSCFYGECGTDSAPKSPAKLLGFSASPIAANNETSIPPTIKRNISCMAPLYHSGAPRKIFEQRNLAGPWLFLLPGRQRSHAAFVHRSENRSSQLFNSRRAALSEGRDVSPLVKSSWAKGWVGTPCRTSRYLKSLARQSRFGFRSLLYFSACGGRLCSRRAAI